MFWEKEKKIAFNLGKRGKGRDKIKYIPLNEEGKGVYPCSIWRRGKKLEEIIIFSLYENEK